MSTALVIPKLTVQKANAFSSPYSVGFPALTAWHGFVHALERLLTQEGFDVALPRFGVLSHDVDVHRHKDYGDRLWSLKDQGKPLKSDGSRPSTMEAATCDMTVTVVIDLKGQLEGEALIKVIQRLLRSRLRCAGGFITNFHKPWLKNVNTEGDWIWLRRVLMPGQALISRRELMQESMSKTGDAIESLIDLVSVHHQCVTDERTGEIRWENRRSQAGWVVPMGVGFCGVSALKQPGETLHARDTSVPHRFVESVVSLCEFVLSYRIENYQDFLWSATYDQEQALYLIESA